MKKGKVIIKTYQIFRGIQLIFTEAHMQNYTFDNNEKCSDAVFEVTYCKEGRIECSIKDKFGYLEPGDLAIVHSNDVSRESCFSFCHFQGISMRIDAEIVSKTMSHILEDIEVEPERLIQKFFRNENAFIVRSNLSMERIFEEIYDVSKKIENGYLKVKVLEILLVLSALETQEDELDVRTYSKTQVVLAKEVTEYLMRHMDVHITLEQLSEHFHVSGSHIKNTFKGVHGVSYYSYVRAQKMQSAAYMLENTDKSILEIAGEHGYENGSKFSSAFKNIMGMSPNEYRKSKCKE